MLEQILNRANLLQAWKRVRANGGVAGIDGLTIDDFPVWLRDHWSEVKASILDGRLQAVSRSASRDSEAQWRQTISILNLKCETKSKSDITKMLPLCYPNIRK